MQQRSWFDSFPPFPYGPRDFLRVIGLAAVAFSLIAGGVALLELVLG